MRKACRCNLLSLARHLLRKARTEQTGNARDLLGVTDGVAPLMKYLKSILWAGLLLAITAPGAFADVTLWEWALNINGTAHASNDPAFPTALPSNVSTTAGWQWNTQDPSTPNHSLGTIAVQFDSPGTYFVAAYFSYAINEVWTNETGTAVGTPAQGLSWEMADAQTGPIYYDVTHAAPGTPLPNLTSPFGTGNPFTGPIPGLAQRLDFTVNSGYVATVSFTWGLNPPSGFYLQQHDPGELGPPSDLYFQSTADIHPAIGAVPEPGSWLLFATVLAGVSTCLIKRHKH